MHIQNDNNFQMTCLDFVIWRAIETVKKVPDIGKDALSEIPQFRSTILLGYFPDSPHVISFIQIIRSTQIPRSEEAKGLVHVESLPIFS